MTSSDLSWGRADHGMPENWPMGPDGQPEQAVLATNLSEGGLADMTAGMLEAYGIPVLRRYQEDGAFARVLFGGSAYGVELLVPASRQSEAVELLASVPGSTEEDEEDGR